MNTTSLTTLDNTALDNTTTSSLTLTSPAKLNLFLHINGRRSDGYHELQTYFQILDRGDTLTFSLRDDSEIRLSPDIPDLAPEDNLIYKAAKRLQDYAMRSSDADRSDLEKLDVDMLGANIAIDKQLPMGGGLGGGSSNAATTLLALNKLWRTNISTDDLAQIGLELGADVPVFVRGKSAFAEGVGEQIIAIPRDENWYLILAPKCHVNTAKIFSNQRLTRDTPKIKIAPASEGQLLEKAISKGQNDCEAVATSQFPEIKEALDFLSKFGAARMTGTGACCFCRFENEAEAQQVLNEASSKFEGFIAKGVNTSPSIETL